MELSVEMKVVIAQPSPPPPPPSIEQSNVMSTLPPNQPEKEQSESAKPTDLSSNQPALESTEGEEEEGECGLCLFMKAGGCKDTFVSWEDCVKEAKDKNEDYVEKCSQVSGLLMQCMIAHSDFYGPILRAEKKAEEQALIELEKEKQEGLASNNNDQK